MKKMAEIIDKWDIFYLCYVQVKLKNPSLEENLQC